MEKVFFEQGARERHELQKKTEKAAREERKRERVEAEHREERPEEKLQRIRNGITANAEWYMNKSGVYEIIFPNGKRYIGASKNIGVALRNTLSTVFIPKNKKEGWMRKAAADNMGLPFTDLKIDVTYCDERVMIQEKHKIMKLMSSVRSIFYNPTWTGVNDKWR